MLKKFYTTWVWGVACQKQRLGQNWRGAGVGEHPKIWDTLHISATVELATSNLVHNLRLGLAYQNQRFGPKLEGGFARGAFKTLGPLRISATVEANNFKFGTQIGFGTSLPKNELDQNWRGSGLGSIQKKNWTLYLFMQLLNWD